MLLVLAAVWLARVPVPAFGHPDLEAQIAAITAQIKNDPRNAVLYLRRGDAYRLHREFDLALADFAAAARMNPGWLMPRLARAQTFYDAGRPDQALQAVEYFLAGQSGNGECLLLRGRCYLKLGNAQKAVADYDAALASVTVLTADLFLERARLQAALGRLDAAVKGLDDGIARMGPAPGLVMAAIELERQQGEFDGALQRIGSAADRSAAKEPWLVLRGEVLEQAGRLSEARGAYEEALQGVESYSSARRARSATLELEKRARDGLVRTGGAGRGEGSH